MAHPLHSTDQQLTSIMQELRAVLPKLDARSHDFAASLLETWNRYGRLTPRQEVWPAQLIERATKPAPTPVSGPSLGSTGFARIAELFAKAAGHLKYPKVTLQTASGQPVVLYRAGQRSKAPGTINITDGGSYGENRWFGRIETTGTWTTPRNGVPAGVQQLVRRFAADPVAVAAEYGRVTGACCFCRQTLSTEESLTAGYGPVCADHYGLDWGTKVRQQPAA